MNDLETRVRDEFHSEPAYRSPDNLLDDVRRGVRHRRLRRTTTLVAAAVVVIAAAAAGGTAARHKGAGPADDPPAVAHQVGAIAVSVTASGEGFKVVANKGCATPCSTIWRQEPSGTWTQLKVFSSASTSPEVTYLGPITNLAMAPDGRNGWAWGTHLWSTHDGGTTWSRVTTLPGGADVQSADVDLIPGDRIVWAMVNASGERQLWRAPVGSDDWTSADAPQGNDGYIAAVLPDSQVVLNIGESLHLRQTVAYGTGSTWHETIVRCYRVSPQFHGNSFTSYLCSPKGRVGDLSGGADDNFKLDQFRVGMVPKSRSVPVGTIKVVQVHRNQAILITPDGVRPVDLRLGADFHLASSAVAGQHVMIVTERHRVFGSDDGGLHWHQD